MSIRHDRDLRFRKGRNRKPRPKSFKTEKSAKDYAEKNGLKAYSIHKKGKKIYIKNG